MNPMLGARAMLSRMLDPVALHEKDLHHFPRRDGRCNECRMAYPCDARQLLDDRDAITKALRRMAKVEGQDYPDDRKET